jgi:hypothetical protein
MKTPAGKGKNYSTNYKKKIVTTDAYLTRGGQGVAVCEGCQAVYRNKRWYVGPEIVKAGIVTVKVVCPACLKIRDNFPGGIVTLSGDYVLPHKMELLKLVKNLTFNTGLSYENGTQGGTTATTTVEENYDWLSGNLGLSHPITKRLIAGLNYRFTIRSSNLPSRDYTQNVVGLRVTYSLQ